MVQSGAFKIFSEILRSGFRVNGTIRKSEKECGKKSRFTGCMCGELPLGSVLCWNNRSVRQIGAVTSRWTHGSFVLVGLGGFSWLVFPG